ncbi:GerW family sporulation protein [Desulfosporosinus burensis]
MGNHPIESLMKTAMESIQQIVDVNTIVGEAVETHDGSMIIPISRVSCGFAAGGSEFASQEDSKEHAHTGGQAPPLPFGGGAGAGVSVQPVAFLVVGNGNIRLLPVDSNVVVDRLIDTVPDLLDRITGMFHKKKKVSEDIIIARD